MSADNSHVDGHRPPGTGDPGETLAERLRVLEWSRSDGAEARLAQAHTLVADAEAAGSDMVAWRARLVAADMTARTGDGVEGARQAHEVKNWATARGDQSLLARTHLVFSSIVDALGDAPAALDHAVAAVELLDAAATPRERGNHLLCLADALASLGNTDDARRRYRQAAGQFEAAGDRERLLNLLNNETVLEYESGNIHRAVAAADRLEVTAGEDMCSDFADTIAHARLVAGDLAAAENAARWAVRLVEEQGESKLSAAAEHALTLAEVLLARGSLDECLEQLDRCLALCDERGLQGLRVATLGLRSELFAARGDYEFAYHAHRAFHAESVALRSQQQEAAAQTRQILFETAEARNEAERFWRQARTDPLTDLYNRRYIDETLPHRLDAPHGQVVVAAILDLDHFKTINDRFTHAIGDVVLGRLAASLRDFVSTVDLADDDQRGFAARLGGEEFLLVWRTTSAGRAVEQADTLRRHISTMSCSDITVGLAITASIGVAVGQDGDTSFTLMSRADQSLYRAKASGRNRVVADLVHT